ncbi:MAG: S8 family serine peptidase [Acidobacteriales bacterium]|nr:S8 family serine peptidase [Terriglobales bacterium]
MRMRAFPLVVVLASLLGGAIMAAPYDDQKIERQLLMKLADDESSTAAFWVVFAERPDLTPAQAIKNKDARFDFVAQKLKETADRAQAGVRGFLQGRKVAFTPFWIENKIYVAAGTLDLARDLSRRPEVVAILAEKVYQVPTPQAGAGIESVEWGVSRIKADTVWGTGTTGTGIVVANIDTGVLYNHQALYRQYRGYNGGTYTHTGNWYDPYRNTSAPNDSNGHGTHTMGTMVGDDGGTYKIGVAPGARWIACKGCRSNYCYDPDLTACAQWMVSTGKPDVVNNSWGGGGGDSWYQSYVDSWVGAGIFPAFSNGNSGPGCSTAGSPGDYPNSFASGATDINDAIASFSSRGPSSSGSIKPDVSAPGVNILSSYRTSTTSYATMNGTSMASPHTAGTVALVWSAGAGYEGQVGSTAALLRNTATRISDSTCGGEGVANNVYGSGLINADLAVQTAKLNPLNRPPIVTITSPINGKQYACGTTVSFEATATDPEDGPLTVTRWVDNNVTFSGADKTYNCSSELGTHVIVASATDSKDSTGSATVTISVIDASIPTAPSNLKANSANRVVTLKWRDNSTSETLWKVERKQTAWNWSTTFVSDTTAATGGTIQYSDSIASTGTYSYRVSACAGATLCSAPSNVVNVRVR